MPPPPPPSSKSVYDGYLSSFSGDTVHWANLGRNLLIHIQKWTTQKFCFVLLLYVPSQQLWSWRDGQFTLPHFFLGKLEQAVNQYFVHIFLSVTDNNPSWMNQRKKGIISCSISTKVWDRTGIKLETPRSAVRLESVARHVTDCAMLPG